MTFMAQTSLVHLLYEQQEFLNVGIFDLSWLESLILSRLDLWKFTSHHRWIRLSPFMDETPETWIHRCVFWKKLKDKELFFAN